MKKALLLTLCIVSFGARAQWLINGTNISNTNTGNVGIGTSSPNSGRLEILADGNYEIYLNGTGSGNLYSSNNLYLLSGFGDIFLGTRGTNAQFSLVNGNVGIGVTPTETLDVNGTARLRGMAQDNTLTRLLVSDANGKLFWRDFSSGGDNLGNHTTTQNLLPGTTNTFNLGSSSNKFKDLYLGGILTLSGLSQDNTQNRILAADVAGRLFWRDVSSFSDNMGNHTATQNILPATNNLYNLGSGTLRFKDLHLGGDLNLSGLLQDNNQTKILASDTNGKIFWRDAPSLAGLPYNNQPGLNSFGGGANSLNTLSTGNNNSAFGFNTLHSNTSGEDNSSFGSGNLNNNTTGSSNSSFGSGGMSVNTTGFGNSGFGYSNLMGNTSGYGNSGFGYSSLFNNTSGTYNTAVGYLSQYYNTTGSYNTAVGFSAGVSNGATISNATAIGAGAIVDVDYGIVLGTTSNLVGIRQSSPLYPLHVGNAYCDGSTWYNSSDKNLKENFVHISANESVLAKVMALPIQYWNYKDAKTSRHIGPTAQDFYKTFQLGVNEKAIASVDEGGVALAAIQELGRKTEQLEKLVREQQTIITTLLNAKVESGSSEKEPGENELQLKQNNPNPFSKETEIRMHIPQGVVQATLYVYDLQGKPIQQMIVPGRGDTSTKIEGGRLSAGLYLYALVADGQSTTVKRMILTE